MHDGPPRSPEESAERATATLSRDGRSCERAGLVSGEHNMTEMVGGDAQPSARDSLVRGGERRSTRHPDPFGPPADLLNHDQIPVGGVASRDPAGHKGGNAGIAANIPESRTKESLMAENWRLRQENARLRHWIEMAAHDCARLIATLERRKNLRGAK